MWISGPKGPHCAAWTMVLIWFALAGQTVCSSDYWPGWSGGRWSAVVTSHCSPTTRRAASLTLNTTLFSRWRHYTWLE